MFTFVACLALVAFFKILSCLYLFILLLQVLQSNLASRDIWSPDSWCHLFFFWTPFKNAGKLSKIGHSRLQPPPDRETRDPYFWPFASIETNFLLSSMRQGMYVCVRVRVRVCVWDEVGWGGVGWSGVVWGGLGWASLGFAGLAWRHRDRTVGFDPNTDTKVHTKPKMNRTSCSRSTPGEYLHPALNTLQSHRPN